MHMMHKFDRIDQLRQEPDYKALVTLLRHQSPDRVEAFLASCDAREAHNGGVGDGQDTEVDERD